MSAPRCPLRATTFDRPDTCDPRCAWLMDDACGNDSPRRACAVVVVAEALSDANAVRVLGEDADTSTWSACNVERQEDWR